jgi:hypothetical protein
MVNLNHQCQTYLVKGLLKGFLDEETTVLPQIVSERVSAYMKWTRKVAHSRQARSVLAQGRFSSLRRHDQGNVEAS